jgi:hypothetical protein
MRSPPPTVQRLSYTNAGDESSSTLSCETVLRHTQPGGPNTKPQHGPRVIIAGRDHDVVEVNIPRRARVRERDGVLAVRQAAIPVQQLLENVRARRAAERHGRVLADRDGVCAVVEALGAVEVDARAVESYGRARVLRADPRERT